MKYLTIDTTTKATALALAEIHGNSDVHVVGEGFLHDQKTHSQRLIPFLDALVTAAGWTLGDLDFIGAVRGPGSFTGIRIGLATAQGLAKVLRRPVYGVLSLACLSWSAVPLSFQTAVPPLSVIIMDARKNEWYAACYRWQAPTDRICCLPPCAVKPADFLRHLKEEQGTSLFAGDAVLHDATRDLIMEELGNRALILPPEHALPRGSYTARECAYAWHKGETTDPSPYYIRLSEAETKYLAACANP